MLALPQSIAGSERRVVFVDALRLLAAVQMVQGHTLDALMRDSARAGRGFELWTFTRGLTSTTFLITAGLAFSLATATPTLAAGGRRRRLRRGLWLVALGYLMHAPLGILLGDAPARALAEWAAVDVLQCIGVSILLLEGVAAWAPARSWGALGVGLAALCFGLGPSSLSLTPRGPLLPFTSYFSAQAGSLFPLLPWAGFVFAGFGAGRYVLRPGGRRGLALRLGLWAALSGALSWALFCFAPASPARVSPAYALMKMALVAGVAAGLSPALEGRRLPRLLRALASETLFIYVSHVVVLYAGHVGLASWIGRSVSAGGALLIAGLLCVASSAGAMGYRRVRQALQARGAGGTPRANRSSPPGQDTWPSPK